jgi:transcriptional regulator with XRE-family HTH domain
MLAHVRTFRKLQEGGNMAATSSPTVKRRRLAAELHACREEAGLTIDDAADQLEWSAAKISRIENARVRVLPRDTKQLLRIYGVKEGSPVWDMLLMLAREAHQKGWWHAYGDAVGESLKTLIGLEAAAATLRTYESECVPGLMQTEDYARAIIRSGPSAVTDEDIESYVTVRMARQERLAESSEAELWAVVGEGAIRRRVGGVDIMRSQLAQLLQTSYRPDVTLQVLPFDAGAHAGMGGSFMMLGYDDPADPDVVYVNYSTGNIFLEKHEEVTRSALIFNHLCAVALSVGQSREMLSRFQDELARPER